MKQIFYGWKVLLGLCLIYAGANGIITLSLKRFYPTLITIFAWDQQQMMIPISAFYLTLAILLPFIGAMLDKFNPRQIIFVGSLFIVLGLIGFGRIRDLNHFIGVYIILGIGLAGAGLASSMYILTKWFHKHRGKAVGILLAGGSLGGALFNKITGDCISTLGWQNATFVLAGLGALFMIIPLFTLVKNTPQEMNLFPDGADRASAVNLVKGVSLIEALKSPTLYIVFLATGILWFCIIGMGQYQGINFEKELLLDPLQVTNVGALFFIFGVLGTFFFGFLSDRFNKKMFMIGAIALLILGNYFLFLIGVDKSDWSPYWYVAIYGITYSGVFTMIQIIVADLYYGPSYGKILGIVLTIIALINASMH